MPFVNVSSSELARGMPSVEVDNRAIGRMAAQHLVECKLDRFAFVGSIDPHACEVGFAAADQLLMERPYDFRTQPVRKR